MIPVQMRVEYSTVIQIQSNPAERGPSSNHQKYAVELWPHKITTSQLLILDVFIFLPSKPEIPVNCK